MIFSDYIFSIGKEHKVCEDYVIVDNEKIPIIPKIKARVTEKLIFS